MYHFYNALRYLINRGFKRGVEDGLSYTCKGTVLYFTHLFFPIIELALALIIRSWKKILICIALALGCETIGRMKNWRNDWKLILNSRSDEETIIKSINKVSISMEPEVLNLFFFKRKAIFSCLKEDIVGNM